MLVMNEEGKSTREAVQAKDDVCDVVMVIDGNEHRFSMPPDDDNIIAAAIMADINAPHACLEGICSSCRARVIEGEVTMEDALGLSPDDRDAGYVLCCQSKPATPKVVLSFDAD